ncbi:ATP-binding cassette domain-containing protein [Chitinophagaceae bacterium LB-8]|uniref:ATP-binding cassette domain-containing protein n=1 Tax=Paraflavisolibacter caeni TaxID=2982496 RepID=A0A9X3BGE3_9BACT|nr:ATP-binding cassette domain-containing protein [Paraflavisolibacter caeni]MCU7547643.1 ATP-binding cassette domain-containing protein [Paraflavisolibacter caeni]
MKIKLSGAGKRFNREWIFRNADLEFLSGISYAITGPNGSGKSTLLQSIAGMLHLNEGSISYASTNNNIPPDEAFQYISFSAPYLEVIEEMTLVEFLKFHFQFKNYLEGMNAQEVIEAIGLQAAAQKQIRYYSSGMKQRVKLAQAIFTNTPVVLLDEPCSNLDIQGIELYHSLIQNYCKERLVIVCSNDEVEYSFCKERIAITNFKSNLRGRAFRRDT